MTILVNGFLAPTAADGRKRHHSNGKAHRNGHAAPPVTGPAPEALRRLAWEIGERRPADGYVPGDAHVGLAAVSPGEGFAHWRIPQGWVDQAVRQKGAGWHNCRLVLRLYDVSYIKFTGLNAHGLRDYDLPSLCGEMLFHLPCPGTMQIAEVGFLLRSGEFVPAARSQTIAVPRCGPSPHWSHAAVLADGGGRVEEIGNIWEQERVLNERRQPRLRRPLRFGALALASLPSGQEGSAARFVSELASGQAAAGHEVHVLVPRSAALTDDREEAGVHYHAIDVSCDGTPLEQARAFGRAAAKRLRKLGPLDLVHLHEWMAALGPRAKAPAVLSLNSLETTRRNGSPPTELSLAIAAAERELAGRASCVLTPDWLRDRVASDLGLADGRVVAFPMEGRLPNEWECPLDYGEVKREIQVGPIDRLLLFVGPLEHAAGVDLLLEALPVLRQRYPGLHLAYAGAGPMHGQLQHRANELGA
jgi:hypothetical protein